MAEESRQMVVPQASAGGRGLPPAPRDTWAPCVLQGALSPPAKGLILPSCGETAGGHGARDLVPAQ